MLLYKFFFIFLFFYNLFSGPYINDGKFSRFKPIIRGIKDIIEFLARKRNIKNYKRKSSNELLHTVKENNQKQKI